MILTDGIVSLDFKGLTWSDRSRDGAAGSERVTLGLRLVPQRLVGSAGKSITIEAKFDSSRLRGCFYFSQLPQLKAWRDNATTLTLIFDTEIRTVMIPLGGINIEPVRQYDRTPLNDEVCAGTLGLLEV